MTKLLADGDNVITVSIADGLYRGGCGAWALTNQYGTQTKLLLQLEIEDVSGNIITVCTDESWDWSNDGPIRFADNKDGEIYDARMVPSYTSKAKLTKYHVVPTASNNVPLTEHEKLKAKLIVTPSGKHVLDFGQNIAGYITFSLIAEAGESRDGSLCPRMAQPLFGRLGKETRPKAAE